MIKYEPLPADLSKKLLQWKSKKEKWLSYAKSCEELFYSDVEGTKTIFTQEQLKKIKEKWNIPLSINKIYPSVSQQAAILSRNKPSFQIVAYDERKDPSGQINVSKLAAETLDKISKHILYNSQSQLQEEEAIKDMLIMGIGVTAIVEEQDYRIGTLGLKYKRINPENITFNPDCFERDLSDLSAYYIEKEMELEQAKKHYQPLIDAINSKFNLQLTMKDFANENTMGFKKTSFSFLEDRVYVLELYDKVYSNLYFINDIENNDIISVFEENLEDEQKFILKNAQDMEVNSYVRRRLFLGKYLVLEELLPITKFPIKVQFFEWKGSIYECYGIVHFIKDMQDAFTKVIQNAIVNGMLTNNAGYIAPKGAITPEDKEKWERLGNYPGVVKEFVPQIVDGILLKPERETIQGLSNFYPFLLETIINGVDLVTGIGNVLRGETKPAIEVFSTLKALQEAATFRLEMILRHITVPSVDIGQALVEYILARLRANEKIILTDLNREIYSVKLSPEEVVNIKLTRYLVMAIPSEELPNKRLAQATELFKISQTTSDPYLRSALIKKAFELSDIPGWDEMKQEADQINIIYAQLQEAQSTINRIKEINKQLENRIIRVELRNKVLTAALNLTRKSIPEEYLTPELQKSIAELTSLEKEYQETNLRENNLEENDLEENNLERQNEEITTEEY